MDKTLIRAAAKSMGGVVRLAEELGLSRGAVSLWKRVPPEHVLDVERLTGVSRHELRPDIFGPVPPVPVPRQAD